MQCPILVKHRVRITSGALGRTIWALEAQGAVASGEFRQGLLAQDMTAAHHHCWIRRTALHFEHGASIHRVILVAIRKTDLDLLSQMLKYR